MQRWDIFCRVVDNFGDIGTCWRLAKQFVSEYPIHLRLWVDDLATFACICPAVSTTSSMQVINQIEIHHWTSEFPIVEVADVVIEAFACETPPTYVEAMSKKIRPPIWINLEYLSAEPWVEECHTLISPQSRSSLKKFFFFPGFTSRTGGVLRESGLENARLAFDHDSSAKFWIELGRFTANEHNVRRRSENNPKESIACEEILTSAPREKLKISLFCYHNPALPALFEEISEGPEVVRVMLCPGHGTEQVAAWFGEPLFPGKQLQRGSLVVQALPFLPQHLYDQLLWACDLNFIRGEDSFIRAQWAQQPFVWQIYPQPENAHLPKLEAFLTRYLTKCDGSTTVRRFFHAWNGFSPMKNVWKDFLAIRHSLQQHNKVWARELDQAGNLADNLVRFVARKYTPSVNESVNEVGST